MPMTPDATVFSTNKLIIIKPLTNKKMTIKKK
jgi:hypothetical protein